MTTRTSLATRLAAFAVAAFTAVGGVALTAAPARANDGVCGSGDLCLYEGYNLSGGQWDDSGTVASYASGHRWWGTTTSINDGASSMRSKYSFYDAWIYEHAYWLGSTAYVVPGGTINDLGGMNNKASSNTY